MAGTNTHSTDVLRGRPRAGIRCNERGTAQYGLRGAERYERRSLILTTNLVFSEWEPIFKDPPTTMAAIDQVVHHSVILDMMSLESYRAKEASAQKAASTAA